MQCHGVCKNTVSSRNFALSILQSEVWEDTVKDEKAGAFLKPFPFFIISSCLYFPQVGIILLIDYDTAHEIGKPLKWNVSLKGCYGSANCGVPQDFYPGLQSVSQSVSSVAPGVSDSLRPPELQHARPPCPSPTPGVYSNSCPSSR